MKKTVITTDLYTIDIDEGKNRAYVRIIGFWTDIAIVGQHTKDFVTAIRQLLPGLTVLRDTRQMKTPPDQIFAEMMKIRKGIGTLGISKIAYIEPASMVARLSTNRFVRQGSVPSGIFTEEAEAEAWLDAP